MAEGESAKPSFLSRIDQRVAGICMGIFLAAAIIRFWGMGWGLPSAERWFSYHPDEHVNVLYAKRIDPLRFQFAPGFYNYGTFYLTLTHFAGSAAAAYGGLGPPPEGQETLQPGQAPYSVRQDALWILGGRVLSVLLGSGVAVLVFLILHRRTHDLGAILGASAAALAPAFVVHSRFASVDVPAAFFIALSLYWAARLVPLPDDDELPEPVFLRFAAWSALAAGMSAAIKYSGIVALLGLAAVVVAARPKAALKTAGIAAGVALAAFLLLVPGVFKDTDQVLKDILYEFEHTATGHGLVFMATSNGFAFHLANLVETTGVFVVLLGVAGLGRASIKKHAWAIGMLAFALIYYILIGRAEVKFLRYVFPLVPVLAVGFGWIVGQAHTHPRQAFKALSACGLVGLGLSLAGVVRDGNWMSGPDPRDEAAAWAAKNVPQGQAVGLVSDPWFQTPPFYPQANAPLFTGFPQRMEWMAQSPVRVVASIPPNPDERFTFDTRLITDLAPEFISISSFEWDDYQRVAQAVPENDQMRLFGDRFRAFEKLLRERYEPAMLFGQGGSRAHDLMYIRPEINLWRKKTASPAP